MSSVVPGLAFPPTPTPQPLWWRITRLLLSTSIGRGILLLMLFRLYLWTQRQRKQRLENQLVLVTGGGNGIGRALCIALAARGARVALWDIDAASLEETCALIRAAHPSAQLFPSRVDLSSRDEIVAAASSLQQRGGFVFCVVNNAGIVNGLPFLDLSAERVRKSMDVNCLAHFWINQAMLPAMMERNSGHLVCVSSAAGLFGAPLMTDYAASKFAAVGLHESLRLEIKKRGKSGVSTTLVCPAHVDTRLFKGYRPGWLQRTLTPGELVLQIVEAIENRTEMVLSPWPVALAYWLRGCLPSWLEDRIKSATGLSNSMDQWRGTNGS